MILTVVRIYLGTWFESGKLPRSHNRFTAVGM